MKDWWLRIGCFLTGYNYAIIKNSSEVSAKAVKRYTSAILIVAIIWSFVGFTFTDRYLKGGYFASFVGALIAVVIIVQIERQIILSSPTKLLYIARGLIAFVMSLIGAVVIDQIIFKEDIDLEKVTFIEKRVEEALQLKTKELRSQIANLDTAIFKKEKERRELIDEVAKNPTTVVYSTQTTTKTEKVTTVDPETGEPKTTEKSVPVNIINSNNVANPKIETIEPLQEVIKDLRSQKVEKEKILLNIRPELEKDIKSKVGFLDELKVMYSLISKSGVALSVWLLWLFFLLGLELLVVFSKASEKENDYDKTVKHQMDLQMRKLDIYANLYKDVGR